MPAIASRVRVASTLAAAGATVIAALALTPGGGAPRAGCPTGVSEYADDGVRLSARRHQGAEDHVVVAIAAPAGGVVRPPLSVAIVIDHSKSMSGEPLAHAKAAAARLISQLDAGDAVAVVAYSDGHATLAPMQRATAVHKAQARRAIDELAVDNGTCISCGLAGGGDWLARTPIPGGVRRMVLISDGYANLGRRDRDELVQLAAEIAGSGASITAVGVGLDFDEQTMMRVADVGRGNYYYVEDTGRLDAAFDREVAGLAETVATDARLVVEAAPGVQIEEVLGHPTAGAGSSVAIPIADLRAGEVRHVVLRVASAGPASACDLAASLSWRRALGGAGRGALALAHPGDADDAGVLARARAAAALELAVAHHHASRGPAAARQHLEDHAAALDEGLPPAVAGELRARLGEAAAAFGAAAGSGGDGAGAVKRARELARELAR